jgi:protein SMG7
MQTSYAFISWYKQQVSELDKIVHPDPRHPPPTNRGPATHGPVEYRKLLGRFRQFLAEEEKFWTQLIVRMRRTFLLKEVDPALVSLGIIPEADAKPEDTAQARAPAEFPEDENVQAPVTTVQRESRYAILAKALICLGDIARYREQYNEGGGRPRAGHEDGPPAIPPKRNGRNRRSGSASDAAPIAKERNYERAQRCYEQARLLLPTDGNASHQLAILATYKHDRFTALVQYYRALCVKQPFDPAQENMGTILAKALEAWKAKRRTQERKAGRGASQPQRLRVETLKEDVTVLHARWRLGGDK